MNNKKKSNWFDANDNYLLKEISFNKKILYYVVIILIFAFDIHSFIYGKIIIPSKNNDYVFTGLSLYLLLLAGLIFQFHLTIQLIGHKIKDERVNNNYYKYAYNSRIFAIFIAVIALIISLFKGLILKV